MKRMSIGTCTVLATCLVLGMVFSSVAQVPQELTLNVGDIRTVALGGPIISADADSDMIKVTGIGQEHLKVAGQRSGIAHLSYQLRDGYRGTLKVTVGGGEDQALTAVREYAEKQLGDIMGIDSVTANDQLGVVEISGTISLFDDWNKYQSLLKQMESRWGSQIISTVFFEPNLKPLEKSLEKALAGELGIRDVSVQVSEDLGRPYFVLRGQAYNQDVRQQAGAAVEALCQDLGLKKPNIQNDIKVTDSIVELEFTYFALSQASGKDFGMDLLNNIGFNIGGEVRSGTDRSPVYTLNANFDLTKVFNFMAQNGLASVKKMQTITTENGKEGQSTYGGEIIIRPQSTGLGTQAATEHVPYGFIIRATPHLLHGQQVRLEMYMEMSSVEPLANGDYAKKMNNVNTSLEAPLDSFNVVSASDTSVTGSGREGTPGLRNLPLLGMIFGRDKRKEDFSYEGFIVVPRVKGAPNLVEDAAISERTEAVLQQVKEQIQEHRGYVR